MAHLEGGEGDYKVVLVILTPRAANNKADQLFNDGVDLWDVRVLRKWYCNDSHGDFFFLWYFYLVCILPWRWIKQPPFHEEGGRGEREGERWGRAYMDSLWRLGVLSFSCPHIRIQMHSCSSFPIHLTIYPIMVPYIFCLWFIQNMAIIRCFTSKFWILG